MFESCQLDPSFFEKDLVNDLVKLDVGDDLGDPATVFSFIENNGITDLEGFKEAKSMQEDMSKREFRRP